MFSVYLAIPLAPLAGAVIAGLFGRAIGRAGAHWVTIIGVVGDAEPFNGTVYTWGQ